MNNDIGKRIKDLRVSRGMNQSALGSVLGVGQVAISMIENNTNKPTIPQLEILSDYFCVSTDYLIKGCEFSSTSHNQAA